MRKLLPVAIGTLLLTASPLGGQDIVAGWTVQSDRDAIDDTPYVGVGKEGEDGAFGLMLVCRGQRAAAAVLLLNPADRLDLISMSESSPKVTYRYDDYDPVGPSAWRTDDDHSMVLVAGADARSIMREIGGHQQIALRVFAPDGSAIDTDVVQLDGVGQALERLPCRP